MPWCSWCVANLIEPLLQNVWLYLYVSLYLLYRNVTYMYFHAGCINCIIRIYQHRTLTMLKDNDDNYCLNSVLSTYYDDTVLGINLLNGSRAINVEIRSLQYNISLLHSSITWVVFYLRQLIFNSSSFDIWWNEIVSIVMMQCYGEAHGIMRCHVLRVNLWQISKILPQLWFIWPI